MLSSKDDVLGSEVLVKTKSVARCTLLSTQGKPEVNFFTRRTGWDLFCFGTIKYE